MWYYDDNNVMIKKMMYAMLLYKITYNINRPFQIVCT
jgi:hypothetical protein